MILHVYGKPQIASSGLHLEVTRRYRRSNPHQMLFDSHIPVGDKLSADNRWRGSLRENKKFPFGVEVSVPGWGLERNNLDF